MPYWTNLYKLGNQSHCNFAIFSTVSVFNQQYFVCDWWWVTSSKLQSIYMRGFKVGRVTFVCIYLSCLPSLQLWRVTVTIIQLPGTTLTAPISQASTTWTSCFTRSPRRRNRKEEEVKEKVEKEEEEEEVEEEVRPILVQSTKGISYFSSLHSVVYFQNANIDRVDEEGHGRKLFWKMKLKMKFYTFGILNFLKGFLSLQCT